MTTTSATAPTAGASNPTKHCTRCGKPEGQVSFRSDGALKCTACDEVADKEKKAYHRRYHQARHRAVQALIALHPKQFDRLFEEERAKVDAETAAS